MAEGRVVVGWQAGKAEERERDRKRDRGGGDRDRTERDKDGGRERDRETEKGVQEWGPSMPACLGNNGRQ